MQRLDGRAPGEDAAACQGSESGTAGAAGVAEVNAHATYQCPPFGDHDTHRAAAPRGPQCTYRRAGKGQVRSHLESIGQDLVDFAEETLLYLDRHETDATRGINPIYGLGCGGITQERRGALNYSY